MFEDGEEVQIHKDAEVKVFVYEEQATYDFEASWDFQDQVRYQEEDSPYYSYKEALEAYAPNHPDWEWNIY